MAHEAANRRHRAESDRPRLGGPAARRLPAAGSRRSPPGTRVAPGPLARLRAPERPRGVRAAGPLTGTQDTLEIADRLRGLRVPAAVVWGAADRFQKVEYGRRVAADLGARLTEIPGGRHFVPEDHPREVAEAIAGVVATMG